MKHMNMPHYLWGEAVRHSTYLINRLATRTLKYQSPYECFKGKKPNVRHIRVFGCTCYAKRDTHLLKKLDDRSRDLVHLGVEPGSKAYRLYDPRSHKVVVSRDVVFDENKAWSWNKVRKNSTEVTLELEFPARNVEEEDKSETEESTCDKEEEESDGGDDSEAENSETPILRRSTRTSTRP